MQATAGVAGLRPNNPNGYLLGTYRIATAPGGIAGFMAALVAALWAFDGWADLTMLGGEIRRPERSIPIALILGVGTVAVLYVLNNAAVQYVLPASQIAASPRPCSTATAIAVGAWGAAVRGRRGRGSGRPSGKVWRQIRIIRREFIATSAGSLNQGKARGGGYSRGKMQADITKVTGLSRNGNNPTYSKGRNIST